MSDYNGYDVWRLAIPATPTAYYKELTQQTMNKFFEDSSNIESVTHTNYLTGLTTTVKVRAIIPYRAKSSSQLNNDDFRKFIFQNLDYSVNLGDLFVYDSSSWIVTNIDDSNVVMIRRCNNTLKFRDEANILQEIPCVATNRIENLDNDKYVVLLDGKMLVIVSYNTASKKIKLSPNPTRFLLNGAAFKTNSIDKVNNIRNNIGYLTIMLDVDTIITGDDLINNIANNTTTGGGLW